MEFLKVLSVKEVIKTIEDFQPLDVETVPLDRACKRILAETIFAGEPVPHFRRATMDGYAVRARDTFGASESLPALLEVVGSVEMGKSPTFTVEPNQAGAISTGGALPEGSDAVVMIEHTERIDESSIEVYKPVAPGEHVLSVGEDIPEGVEVFKAGRILKPQDIGVLASLGVCELRVYRKPKVAIISTGDEIVPYTTKTPLPVGVVRDVNSLFIAGLCEEVGAEVGTQVLVADDKQRLRDICHELVETHDVVLLSGGSSVGIRDFTLEVLKELPQSHILFHGVALKPGKPTILATSGKTYLWGLPGQPASALTVMFALVCPFLQVIQGAHPNFPYSKGTVEAVLSVRVPSVHGREDYVPVKLTKENNKWVAQPVFGKSGMVSLLTRADGFITIDEHSEGLDEGSRVTVYLI
ncbi:MAG: gephyrin-like molybdotransferase Glp [Thermodesulforhabdaceae bacterium]